MKAVWNLEKIFDKFWIVWMKASWNLEKIFDTILNSLNEGLMKFRKNIW